MSAKNDRELGIKTTGNVGVAKLDLTETQRLCASPYEPTPFGVLEDMMLSIDIDPARFTFVDLGAGKGRICCLACTWPFQRIVGVELSKPLAKAARHNASELDEKWRRCRTIEIVEGDAAEWSPPLEPLVLYMFNPFGAQVIGRVFDAVQHTYEEHPREIYVLYYMPVWSALAARAPCLSLHAAAQDWTIWIAPVLTSR